MTNNSPEIICIIGAPRTGSTLLYQLIVNLFDTFYFSNSIIDTDGDISWYEVNRMLTYFNAALFRTVPYESFQGKTNGEFFPSEASKLFKIWFGGEHPSQICSCDPYPDQVGYIKNTFQMLQSLFYRPIVIKNAWNCFRIKSLYKLFPKIKFIWIRRDIVHASISDLATRYERGDKGKWSSATTFNWEEIQKLLYWKRPIKQQYWYNMAIEDSLNNLPKNTYITLWYEDLCNNTKHCIFKIGNFCNIMNRCTGNSIPELKQSKWANIPAKDKLMIVNYIKENLTVLKDHLYDWGYLDDSFR